MTQRDYPAKPGTDHVDAAEVPGMKKEKKKEKDITTRHFSQPTPQQRKAANDAGLD